MPEESLPEFPLSQDTWQRLVRELSLSPQQARIVELVLCDCGDKQIAARMGLRVPTVRTYLQRTYLRLGAEGRMGLVLKILALSQEMHLSACRTSPGDNEQ